MARRKRNKEKRAHLKRYASDFIKVTQRPRSLSIEHCIFPDCNCTVDSETGRPVACALNITEDNWLNFRGRVRSVSGPRNNMTPKFNNSWMRPMPVTRGIGAEIDGVSANSQEVTKAAKELPRNVTHKRRGEIKVLAEASQYRIEQWHHIVREQTAFYTLKLFFLGNMYKFVREFETYAQESETYNGRQRAITAYESNKVRWIKTIPTPASTG